MQEGRGHTPELNLVQTQLGEDETIVCQKGGNWKNFLFKPSSYLFINLFILLLILMYYFKKAYAQERNWVTHSEFIIPFICASVDISNYELC